MIGVLRNLVVHDFWLKLFSLGLAFLIWYIVRPAAYKNEASPVAALVNAAAPEQIFPTVSVIIMSTAADVHDFKVSPNQVSVTVSGDARRLSEIHANDIRALVDLTGVEAARGLRKRIEITTPAGITLVRVVPEEVEVIVPGKR
jgi:YbbR domain-containing protein